MSFTYVRSYNFDMQYVYVSLKGKQEPCRIVADRVEEPEEGENKRLIVKNKNKTVGCFDPSAVDGWWTQEEDRVP